MIRFKCNGEPYIDDDLLREVMNLKWTETKQNTMTNISDIVNKAANATPITLETMMAAIDKLNERPSIFPKGHPFHGVFEVKECAWLKGTQVVVISNGKAHY